MAFDSGLKIGDILTNKQIQETFKCGNMGGMRRAKKTGTLVIISDKTKGFYHDKWEDGILLYTGMGKYGDQKLDTQNKTLYESDTNGVEVHLFEVMKKTEYTYRGVVKLAAAPYQTNQPDEEGRNRKVWMFPLKVAELGEELENPAGDKVAKMPVKELVVRSQMIKGKQHEPKVSETLIYHRDPYLKEAVKRIAEGKCQMCGCDAPFIDNYGEPYLEEHHVVRLADGGSDTIDNVVAICPNCHRKIHILNQEEDIQLLVETAKNNVNRLMLLMEYANKLL